MCRELGVSEVTYHRWRNQFGGLKAELELEKSALKEIARGNFLSPERRRAAVHHLQRALGASERFTCRVAGQHRTIQRHETTSATPQDPDAALRDWLARLREGSSSPGFPARLPRRPWRGLGSKSQEDSTALA